MSQIILEIQLGLVDVIVRSWMDM